MWSEALLGLTVGEFFEKVGEFFEKSYALPITVTVIAAIRLAIKLIADFKIYGKATPSELEQLTFASDKSVRGDDMVIRIGPRRFVQEAHGTVWSYRAKYENKRVDSKNRMRFCIWLCKAFYFSMVYRRGISSPSPGNSDGTGPTS